MRSKDEVERAIKIHQNLLYRSNLLEELWHNAHPELAGDYIAAGLLDRAERLLQDPVDAFSESNREALELLLEIYQLAKEWSKSIMIAQVLRAQAKVKSGPQYLDTLDRSTAYF